MPELYYDRRFLDEDGYIDRYTWHMVDTHLLENDIDEALGREATSTAGSLARSR